MVTWRLTARTWDFGEARESFRYAATIYEGGMEIGKLFEDEVTVGVMKVPTRR